MSAFSTLDHMGISEQEPPAPNCSSPQGHGTNDLGRGHHLLKTISWPAQCQQATNPSADH